jgi:starch phosphorylase
MTQRIFSYTNHTLMPEALETWPVSLMQHVLPRHLRDHLPHQPGVPQRGRRRRYPGDIDLMRRVSLIDDGDGETTRVRMAHLSIVGSHRSTASRSCTRPDGADHLRRLRQAVARPLHNKTNGVTPRRWLAQANPGLASLLDSASARTGG